MLGGYVSSGHISIFTSTQEAVSSQRVSTELGLRRRTGSKRNLSKFGGGLFFLYVHWDYFVGLTLRLDSV